MQIVTTAIVAAAAIVQLSPTAKLVRSDPVLVRAVVDGDTVVVAGVGRVRLLGVRAPELGRRYDSGEPFAQEARDRLTSIVLNRWVRLERETMRNPDTHHAAYVLTEDGVFVNALLAREGLVRVTAHARLARLAELQQAESDARAFRRGMWGAAPQAAASGYTRASGARRSPGRRHKPPAQHAKQKPSAQ